MLIYIYWLPPLISCKTLVKKLKGIDFSISAKSVILTGSTFCHAVINVSCWQSNFFTTSSVSLGLAADTFTKLLRQPFITST